MIHSVLSGRHADTLGEYLTEIVVIVKANLFGNFRNFRVAAFELVFGDQKTVVVDIVAQIRTGLFLKQLGKAYGVELRS